MRDHSWCDSYPSVRSSLLPSISPADYTSGAQHRMGQSMSHVSLSAVEDVRTEDDSLIHLDGTTVLRSKERRAQERDARREGNCEA
jgi:hypothetical protein